MNVNILGTVYEIKYLSEAEFHKLKTFNASGLAELYSKELIIDKNMDDGSGDVHENFQEYRNKVLRHEIIHAFFHESGLTEYCHDENLVEWLALQVPKILKAFNDTNCL